MLQARSLRSRARKKSDDLTTAIVLAGTSFSRLCGNRVFLFVYAAASLFDQVNSVLSIHMRCRMTASLRAGMAEHHYRRTLHLVCTENLGSDVMVMKSTQNRV